MVSRGEQGYSPVKLAKRRAKNSSDPGRPGEELPLDEVMAYLEDKRKQADDRIIVPVQSYLSNALATYPMTFAFLAVFAALSLIPVLTFLGFCIFAGSVLVGAAAVFVGFWAAVLISAAAGVLLLTLALTFVSSVFLCGFLASGFFALRLFHHLTTNSDGLVAGFKAFGGEARERTVGPSRRLTPPPPSEPVELDGVGKQEIDLEEKQEPGREPERQKAEAMSPESSSSDSWKAEDP